MEAYKIYPISGKDSLFQCARNEIFHLTEEVNSCSISWGTVEVEDTVNVVALDSDKELMVPGLPKTILLELGVVRGTLFHSPSKMGDSGRNTRKHGPNGSKGGGSSSITVMPMNTRKNGRNGNKGDQSSSIMELTRMGITPKKEAGE